MNYLSKPITGLLTKTSQLFSGRVIHKFITYSVKTNSAKYSGIYIAKVKEYFLIIKADYADKQFGDEIEKAILNSKFD